MPDWALDTSRKIPIFTMDLPDHAGKIVVQKAASWIWTGVFEPEHLGAAGCGFRSDTDAKAAALEWAKEKLGI